MTNEQIAHDLAVARMAGKQLPAKELVEEYQSAKKIILDFLKEQSSEKENIKVLK